MASSRPRLLSFPVTEHAIRALFPDAQAVGEHEWAARCPAHTDGVASLSIGIGKNNRPLLHCHAKCSNDAIAEAVGLSNQSALYSALEGRSTPSSVSMKELLAHPTRRYFYHNEHGRCLYAIQRYDYHGDKTFRQFQPDGTAGIKGVRRVVYHLRKLRQQSGTHVYWVEGEKCVRALERKGLHATTSAGGANGYKEESQYPHQLKEAGITHVTVLPDHDDAGRAYANRVAQDLHANGIRVKVLPLPDLTSKGDDVADWFAAGHTSQELRQLRKNAPAPSQDYHSLEHVKAEVIEWFWKPYIPKGKLTLIDGDPGTRKSYLTLKLAADLSRGVGPPDPTNPKMKRRCKPGNVLLCSTEDGEADTIVPRLDNLDADRSRIFYWDTPLTLDDAGAERLERAIRDKDIALVIIDPLTSFVGADVDIYRANEVRPVMDRLKRLAERYHCTIVMVRHTTKDTKGKALVHRGQGNVDFSAIARSVLIVVEHPYREDCSVILPAKNSNARKGDAFEYEVTDTGLAWGGISTVTERDLQRGSRDDSKRVATRWLSEALQDGPVTQPELEEQAEVHGLSWRMVERAAKTLVHKKRIYTKGKKGVQAWTWTLRPRTPPTARLNPEPTNGGRK